jgi:V8-like Glu-specific endopeptidase
VSDDVIGIAVDLSSAINRFDLEAARLLAARLANSLDSGILLPPDTAIALIRQLLAKRWFDVADLLSDPLLSQPEPTPELQRRVAQVMIERCRYGPALRVLSNLKQADGVDLSEVFGHIGRVEKQKYVESVEQGEPDDRLLAQATRTYLAAYQEDPRGRTWHGINAAGLMRLSGDSDANEQSRQIAADIQRALLARPRSELTYWDMATVAETALALDDWSTAGLWMRAYVKHADAFALSATLRQLEQIWRLPDFQEPQALGLLDLIRAAQLQRVNGSVEVEASDVQRILTPQSPLYEAVFGADRFESLENYKRGLARASCVARIGRVADMGVGSGFLLDAATIGFASVVGPVLVTNAHVLSTEAHERNQGALHPSEAVVTFEALPGVEAHREFAVLPDVLFSSPRTELDVTIVRLAPAPPPFEPFVLASVLPVRNSRAPIRVIGHPSGRGLSFSINELLDHQDPRVHYRTATEGGSSGCPAFNQEWKLVALHHTGGHTVPKLNGQIGTYQANEGIWIGAIRNAIIAASS